MSYRIIQVVDADEVPDWERRPPKWADLVEKVMDLKPNQSLEVEFDDAKAAHNARNAVRDQVNLQARAAVVRTRVVKKDDGKATLYFVKLHEENTGK